MFIGFLALIALASVFFGLGLGLWWVLSRVTGLSPARPLWGELGLIGMFGLGNAALAWNLLWPVNSAFTILLAATGVSVLVASLARHGDLRRSLGRLPVTGSILAALLTVFFGLAPLSADSGLYHLPEQLWMRSEAIVVGLANFDARFGLNSILNPISAGFWLGENLALLAIIDALFLFFYLLTLSEFLLKDDSRKMPMSFFFAVLSPLSLLLFDGFFYYVVIANDTPAAMLVLSALFLFIRLHERIGADAEAKGLLMSLLVLAAFAICVKLSSIPVLVLMFLALLTSWLNGLASRRRLVLVTGVVAALGLPLLIRGFLISGCLVFPVAKSCLTSLQWSAEVGAENVHQWIVAWARAPRTGTGLLHAEGWDWLPLWWTRLGESLVMILVVAAVVGAFAAGLRAALRGVAEPNSACPGKLTSALARSGVAAFSAFSLALWFVKAPELRFGIATLHTFTLAPALLLFAAPAGSLEIKRETWRSLGRISVMLVLAFALNLAGQRWGQLRKGKPSSSFGLFAPVPEVTQGIHFGVTARRCWLTPNCSPYDPPISVDRHGRWLMMVPLATD